MTPERDTTQGHDRGEQGGRVDDGADEAAGGLVGAAIDGPTSGVQMSGAGGRVPGEGVDSPVTGADVVGDPGARGPHSPAASDVTLSANDATTPDVVDERRRIVERTRQEQERTGRERADAWPPS